MQRVFLRDTQEKTLESHNELFFDIDESLYNICLRLFATRWAINTKGTTVVVTHCPRFNYLGHYESWGPPSTVFQYLRSSLAAFLLFSVELNGIIGCVWQVEQTEWLSVAVAGIPDSILTNGAWQTEEDDGALRAPDCATRALRFSSKFWLGPQPKKLEKPERKTFTIKKEARYGDNTHGPSGPLRGSLLLKKAKTYRRKNWVATKIFWLSESKLLPLEVKACGEAASNGKQITQRGCSVCFHHIAATELYKY